MGRLAKAPREDWITPRWILDALGPFTLDPCAQETWPFPWATASACFKPPKDGLALPWIGLVWLNPPYGPSAKRWVKKLADHGSGIALLLASVETRWFVEQVWRRAMAVIFLEGRLSFHEADGSVSAGNAGSGSCLVAYGGEALIRLKHAFVAGRIRGTYVETWRTSDADAEAVRQDGAQGVVRTSIERTG